MSGARSTVLLSTLSRTQRGSVFSCRQICLDSCEQKEPLSPAQNCRALSEKPHLSHSDQKRWMFSLRRPGDETQTVKLNRGTAGRIHGQRKTAVQRTRNRVAETQQGEFTGTSSCRRPEDEKHTAKIDRGTARRENSTTTSCGRRETKNRWSPTTKTLHEEFQRWFGHLKS